tara:strand:- start:1527 stop:2507 length:981 start_codon:yes stop_codon:yes gene_type:complete
MVILHKDIIEDLEFGYPIIKENNWTLFGYPVELYHDGTPCVIQIHGGKRPPSLRRVHHAYERTITNIFLEWNPTIKGQATRTSECYTFGNQYSLNREDYNRKWGSDFTEYHTPPDYHWEEFERNTLEDELVLLTSMLNTTRIDNSVIDDLIDFRFLYQRLLDRFPPMIDWSGVFDDDGNIIIGLNNQYHSGTIRIPKGEKISLNCSKYDIAEWLNMNYTPQMLKVKNFVMERYPFKQPMSYRVVGGSMPFHLEQAHDYPHPIYQCVDEGKKIWLKREEFEGKMDNVYKYLALKNRFLNPKTEEWEFKTPNDLLNNYKQWLWKNRSK